MIYSQFDLIIFFFFLFFLSSFAAIFISLRQEFLFSFFKLLDISIFPLLILFRYFSFAALTFCWCLNSLSEFLVNSVDFVFPQSLKDEPGGVNSKKFKLGPLFLFLGVRTRKLVSFWTNILELLTPNNESFEPVFLLFLTT